MSLDMNFLCILLEFSQLVNRQNIGEMTYVALATNLCMFPSEGENEEENKSERLSELPFLLVRSFQFSPTLILKTSSIVDKFLWL